MSNLIKVMNEAAFALETVAHLLGKERLLLPHADALRAEVAKIEAERIPAPLSEVLTPVSYMGFIVPAGKDDEVVARFGKLLTAEHFKAMVGYYRTWGHVLGWKRRLTDAWLNDHPEQYGVLRNVRNSYDGIEDAFARYDNTLRAVNAGALVLP